MERALQGDNAREQANCERWTGGCGSSITPFQFSDESPTLNEWKLHHDEKNPDNDHPIGFKEVWSFGSVVFKRYYRYDGSQASLHRVLESWTGNTVNASACRLLGSEQRGCAYSIRFRGTSLSVSGGSRALQHIIEMAIWTKLKVLQFTPSELESPVSRGCLDDNTVIKTESE